MARTALPSARLRQALWRGGLGAALALAFATGAALPVAAAEQEPASDTVYRFPFDPRLTTPEGGEFASMLANGEQRSAPHRGHDFSFGGAEGTAIPAISAGIVRGKSTDGSLGNCVALEHTDGVFSAYCHMAQPSPLELGQRVELGDPVGFVGGTPDVAVHLHLTMGWSVAAMSGIDTFDPIPYIQARLANSKPAAEPEAEKPAPEKQPEASTGLALTHSVPTAV